MSLYESIKSSLKESEEGIRKKQLINNIEALLYSYDVSINDGYAEPFKSDEEMVDYVYRQVFDLKDDGTGFTKWADGICDDLKYLGKDYIVNEIKRIGHEIGVVQMKESEETKNNLKESYSIEEVKDLLEELIGECRDYPENSPGYIYHSAINYLKDAGQDKLAIYLETCYDRCETSYIKNSSVIDDLRYVLSKLGSIKESVKVGPIYRLGTEDFITSYNDIRLDEIGITLEDIELFKRVDTSESAPDKVNYLLYISMRWDGDKTISVPISYNISDNEYEEEINPPMLGIYDEDLDSQVYDTVDEVVRNLALKVSQSGRMNEFDSFNATPEEIDDYYSNEYYNKTQEETDPEKKFKNACYTAASQWMSGVNEETSKEFIEDMILPIAKNAYNSPTHSDEDYLNEIIFNLENERGFRFDFNK